MLRFIASCFRTLLGLFCPRCVAPMHWYHSHQAVCCNLCTNDDWKQYVEQEHASHRWESEVNVTFESSEAAFDLMAKPSHFYCQPPKPIGHQCFGCSHPSSHCLPVQSERAQGADSRIAQRAGWNRIH